MNIASLIALYFVIWWLCLFAVLPFGVKSQHEDAQSAVPGTEMGAPQKTGLLPKMLITSVLAAAVTGLLVWALSNPIIQEYWR